MICFLECERSHRTQSVTGSPNTESRKACGERRLGVSWSGVRQPSRVQCDRHGEPWRSPGWEDLLLAGEPGQPGGHHHAPPSLARIPPRHVGRCHQTTHVLWILPGSSSGTLSLACVSCDSEVPKVLIYDQGGSQWTQRVYCSVRGNSSPRCRSGDFPRIPQRSARSS